MVDCGWEDQELPFRHIIDPRSGFRAFEWFFRVMGGWDGVEAEFLGRRSGSCDELFDGCGRWLRR
jgi:hypothetical protein